MTRDSGGPDTRHVDRLHPLMTVDQSRNRRSRLTASSGFQLANRIGAVLLATISGFASWYAAEGVLASLASGGSWLHPSRTLVRPLGILVSSLLTLAYFAWAAFVNHPWVADGEDLDQVT